METNADLFDSVSWGNDDGTLAWTGDWQGGGSPSSGFVFIVADSGGPLRLLLRNGTRVYRQMNAPAGTVSISAEIGYRRATTSDGAEFATSSDGSTWTLRHAFPSGDDVEVQTVTVSIPISELYVSLLSSTNFLYVDSVTVTFSQDSGPESGKISSLTAALPTGLTAHGSVPAASNITGEIPGTTTLSAATGDDE